MKIPYSPAERAHVRQQQIALETEARRGLRYRLSAAISGLTAAPEYLIFHDVSRYQGSGYWQELWDAGHRVVYMKATESDWWEDPEFQQNWKDAHELGFLIGTYLFFRGNRDGIVQARWHRDVTLEFHNAVNGVRLPVMVDVESDDNVTISTRRARLSDCLQELEFIYGQTPVIYSAAWAWNQWIGSVSWANDYYLWPASWSSADNPYLPVGWDMSRVIYWQFCVCPRYWWCTPCPHSLGGEWDVDRSYLTLDELKQLAGAEQPEPRLRARRFSDIEVPRTTGDDPSFLMAWDLADGNWKTIDNIHYEVPESGEYDPRIALPWDVNANGWRHLDFVVNGVPVWGHRVNASSGWMTFQVAAFPETTLLKGDKVRIQLRQSAPVPLKVKYNSRGPAWTLRRVG